MDKITQIARTLMSEYPGMFVPNKAVDDACNNDIELAIQVVHRMTELAAEEESTQAF